MKRYYYYRCTKTFKQDWSWCTTKQVSAERLERSVFDNIKRFSLDTNYIDSLIFKLNFEALGRHQGLEPSRSCSPIDPKTVQESLKTLVETINKVDKIDQSLIIKKYIKNILYSKESIQINMLCHPEAIDRQSIKNPAPLEESGVCGRARAAAKVENFSDAKQKRDTASSIPSLNMAPR
jgi:D-mannonate dehydratase